MTHFAKHILTAAAALLITTLTISEAATVPLLPAATAHAAPLTA